MVISWSNGSGYADDYFVNLPYIIAIRLFLHVCIGYQHLKYSHMEL